MEWLVHNIGSVIAMIVAVAGLGTTWVLYGADIRQLKADRDAEKKRADDLEKDVQRHIQDNARHIDQYRDERRFDEFKGELLRRFDGVETRFDTTDRKIERLMIIHPSPPRV